MAKTEFGVNDPLTVSVWSKELANEAYRKTYVGKFIGESEDSLIQEKTDLKKSAGDNITCGLNIQLDGDGVQGDATMEGNEEALQFYDDKIFVDQLRNASRIKGKMTEQRTWYNLRETSKDRLADWYARRMDHAFFNQVCGNTAQTDTRYTGLNAVAAPSANRIQRAGNFATDELVTSSDVMELQYIDTLRTLAEGFGTDKNTGPLMRPIRMDGNDYYVMFLHDFQVNDLRTNVADGQWLDIQKAAMQGGDVTSNPIFTGALGVYNGVILHKAVRVTEGVNSTTNAPVVETRRAVLCGAQAATIAFGSENSTTKFTWVEELFDYGNQFGCSAGAIWGLKKTKYIPENDAVTNAEDFSSLVLTTWAVAPTTA